MEEVVRSGHPMPRFLRKKIDVGWLHGLALFENPANRAVIVDDPDGFLHG